MGVKQIIFNEVQFIIFSFMDYALVLYWKTNKQMITYIFSYTIFQKFYDFAFYF